MILSSAPSPAADRRTQELAVLFRWKDGNSSRLMVPNHFRRYITAPTVVAARVTLKQSATSQPSVLKQSGQRCVFVAREKIDLMNQESPWFLVREHQ
jgi:hypothetical protein